MRFIYTILMATVLSVVPFVTPKAIAQDEYNSDAYDPFADYSEFDQASEEEADINFFRNGRFFTLGFMGGYRMFTSVMGQLYTGAPNFGAYISYFFDLRFALQFTYITGTHRYYFSHDSISTNGNASIQEMGVGIKYYLNTQNVTRGLAAINPYVLFGMEQIYRTQQFDNTVGYAQDNGLGFASSFGIEFPLMRNKMYFGAEATYVYVNFADENQDIVVGDQSTGVFPTGDMVRFMGLIGINF